MQKWLTLIEFINYKKVSISTVRRWVKGSRLDVKMVDGKYYVLVKDYTSPNDNIELSTKGELVTQVRELTVMNQKLEKKIVAYKAQFPMELS